MRRGLRTALLSLALLAAAADPAGAAVGPAPPVAAASVLVATEDGEILYADEAREPLPMASITKLMTALVALEQSRPGRLVRVDPAAVGIEGSSVYLQPGERITIRDLLAAALIQSANDAAYALAAATTGGDVEAFVRRMNRKARALGLDDTHYENPAGLDAPGHASSARDILTLAREAMEVPIVRRLVRKEAGTYGARSLNGWNDLLESYPGVFGVKTGHTDEAGWCQVAVARRGETVVYAVILGSPTRAARNADLAELLTFGLDHFGERLLVRGGTEYASATIPFEDGTVRLVADRAAAAVVRVDLPLEVRVVGPAAVEAPVARGEAVGAIRVTQRGNLVAEVPLVAARAVEEPSLELRASWYADRALEEAGDLLGAVIPGL